LSARELDQIPIIVERLKERVDPVAVTAEISELWTSAAVMAGPRFPWELIKQAILMAKRKVSSPDALVPTADYDGLLGEVVVLLESARRTAARAVNAVMTATYWEIGQRIVEVEQRGRERAAYGSQLIERLADDLSKHFGRGFSRRNLEQMRLFYLGWPIAQTVSAQFEEDISPTVSAKSVGQTGLIPQTPTVELGIGKALTPSAQSPPEKPQTPSGKLPTVSAKSVTAAEAYVERPRVVAARFPLPWSHYVRLLAVKDENASRFYEQEALRGE